DTAPSHNGPLSLHDALPIFLKWPNANPISVTGIVVSEAKRYWVKSSLMASSAVFRPAAQTWYSVGSEIVNDGFNWFCGLSTTGTQCCTAWGNIDVQTLSWRSLSNPKPGLPL